MVDSVALRIFPSHLTRPSPCAVLKEKGLSGRKRIAVITGSQSGNIKEETWKIFLLSGMISARPR